MSSSKKGKAEEPDLGGIDENTESTNQEAVAIPYMAGEFRAKVTWLSPVYNQYSRPAPNDKPGKK